MGLKYTIDFTNTDNSREFQITIYDVNFSGASTSLVGATRPFILREFNSNEDLFKPIRAMMAEINIITDNLGVTLDDFVSENDTDITVILYASMPFGSIEIFNGILLQDDFQETWVDHTHVLTLKAADRFGYLKSVQLSNNGFELEGKYTPLRLIRYCLKETSLSQNEFYIFNNLFHDSMVNTPGNTPLTQCLIDARTFQKEGTEYDDAYTVLEKINKSFNQTIFAYRNRAFILRQEELYTSYTNNLRGLLLYDPGVGAEIYPQNKRFEFHVGVNELVKPIAPEMIRFFDRKTKTDTIQFDFEQYPEIVKNQNFSRGTLVSETPFRKVYTVDDWVGLEGPYTTAVPIPSNAFYRIQDFSDTRSLIDEYIALQMSPTLNRWVYSSQVEVLANELFTISFDIRFAGNFPVNTTISVAQIQLENGSLYYTLDDNGAWVLTNSTFSTNSKNLRIYYNGNTKIIPTDWNTIEVFSKPAPITGNMRILLKCDTLAFIPSQAAQFKDLKINYSDSVNSLLGKSIKSIQSIYTKIPVIKNNFNDTIFLDDNTSKQYKGAMFEMDGTTLTDKNWYRYRYPTERYGFRQQNAIAHWEHNRNNRNKIDATFFGCFWNDGVNDEVISPINTLRFIDDDINRVYTILNLKEMDFATNTWNATLLEVFNEVLDTDISVTFSAIFNQAVYNISVVDFKLPMTLITAGGFVINTGDTAKYIGATSMTTPVNCTVAGFMKITNPQQTVVTLSLRKNGTVIKTASLQVFNPNTPFSFGLSTDPITINTNDEFTVTLSPNISQIQILGGSIQINSPATTQSFDNYQDKYIYK